MRVLKFFFLKLMKYMDEQVFRWLLPSEEFHLTKMSWGDHDIFTATSHDYFTATSF